MTHESKNVTPLDLLLSERALRLMAGAACFDRGRRYATESRVKQLKATSTEISCRVIGSTHYDVRVWAGKGDLAYSCTCPMGRAEAFCKHVSRRASYGSVASGTTLEQQDQAHLSGRLM